MEEGQLGQGVVMVSVFQIGLFAVRIRMAKPKIALTLALVLSSAGGFGTLTQIEVPGLLKPALLLLPLQLAAIAYVIWYWRDRPVAAHPIDHPPLPNHSQNPPKSSPSA